MPISVFTGLPGHGKTSLMVEDLLAEAAKKPEERRPLYQFGIDGLQPGIAEPLENPLQWNAYTVNEDGACHCDASKKINRDTGEVVEHPRHDHAIPDGSKIYIDEAWKYFGHLQDARQAKTPDHVLALAEHRHRGIDFVWTTQSPVQIFPFARAMCAEHTHVLRRFGTRFIETFRWEELNEDVKSTTKRENAQRTTRMLPAKAWKVYKSASTHTIKAKLPFKVIALPVVVVAAVFALYYAIHSLRPDSMTGKLRGEGPNAAAAASAPPSQQPAARTLRYNSAAEYIAATTPRLPAAPWTDPAHDGRPVVSDPHVYCVASQPGLDANGHEAPGGCRCLTEQGTRYVLPEPTCRLVAAEGEPYNPFKAPAQDQAGAMRDDQARRPGNQVNARRTSRGQGDVALVQPQGGFGRDLAPYPAGEAHF